MNSTKKLLLGLVTVAAMPAFADTKTTTTSSGQSYFDSLFFENFADRLADLRLIAVGEQLLAALYNRNPGTEAVETFVPTPVRRSPRPK
jgi:hypothetical protein